jgi:hypothetical protein
LGPRLPQTLRKSFTSARRGAVISVSTKHPTKQPPGVTTASQRSTPLSTTQVPSPDFLDVENAIAADPLIDLAMTIRYDLDKSPHKRAGLLDGYGPLPTDEAARLDLYRLYHALELWDWFASIGETRHLPAIADDIRSLATSA